MKTRTIILVLVVVLLAVLCVVNAEKAPAHKGRPAKKTVEPPKKKPKKPKAAPWKLGEKAKVTGRDLVAQAACVSNSAGSLGYVVAVRRPCTSKKTPSCNEICRDNQLRQQDKRISQHSTRGYCTGALKMYAKTTVRGNLSIGMKTFVWPRWGCLHQYCGPNYCCCHFRYKKYEPKKKPAAKKALAKPAAKKARAKPAAKKAPAKPAAKKAPAKPAAKKAPAKPAAKKAPAKPAAKKAPAKPAAKKAPAKPAAKKT